MAAEAEVHVALATSRGIALGRAPQQDAPRLRALRSPADRAAAGAAGALLRRLLAEVTGLEDPVLVRRCGACGGPHGAPHVVGGDVHVSVSWGRTVVAVALTAAGPVGVDVEPDDATCFDGFDAVALAPGETAGTPAPRPRLWTRKEAVLKAAGVGLTVDPREVRVADGQAQWRGSPVQLLDVPAPPGTTCSAAVLSAGTVALVVLDGDALLRR